MGNSFWSDPNLEPKRNFRFVLYMGGVPTWVIKKVKKPSFEVGEAEHQYLNHTFYYPGRVKWSEIDITLVDPVDPDATMTMQQILHDSGYFFPTDPNSTQSISKVGAVASMGNLNISMLDAEGNAIETTKLYNPWIKKVDFSELSYDNEDLTELTLTVRFDYAESRQGGQF